MTLDAHRKLLANRVAAVIALFVCLSCGGGDGATGTVDVASLRFVLQPVNTGAGAPLNVSVELLSAGGARVTGATNQITLTISGGATLGGATSANAAAGVATFSGVTVNTVAQNLQLTAHMGTISATSNTFNVVAGPVSAATSTYTLTPTSPAANTNATLTITLKDAANNPVGGAVASFSANVAGATFTPTSATTDASGVASTVFRSTASGPVAITVTVGGTPVTFQTPVTVAGGCSAGTLTLATPVNATVNSGTACTLNGHPAASFRFTVPAGNAIVVGMGGTGSGGVGSSRVDLQACKLEYSIVSPK